MKKTNIYVFIYKYIKILQCGALASWGLKNEFISTKHHEASNKLYFLYFLYRILMKALVCFKTKQNKKLKEADYIHQ